MNMPPITAPARKFIGVGILAVSLLSAMTGCAGGSNDAAPAASASTNPVAAATPSAANKVVRTQLVSIIDAATIEVRPVNEKNGEPTGEPSFKVRMLGVAAPAASDCGAPEALAHLKTLIDPNEFVKVTYEPTLGDATDKDGNTLAYVMTGASTTQDIGLRMVEEGNAAASYPEGKTIPKRFEQYAKNGKFAVDQKKGIWASCPAPKV